jgi:creatinine amidohydrolase
MYLSDLSWPEAQTYFSRKDIALIPVGAQENHGNHLPLGTDSALPRHLAGRIAQQREILIAPLIPYGVSDHHAAFPGTVSIGYEGLWAVVDAVVRSLANWGIRRFIFLNGHGGNSPVLNRACLQIGRLGGVGVTVNWWQLAGELNPLWKGGHAGGQETAAMLAVCPDCVHMESIADFTPRRLTDRLRYASLGRVELDGVGVDMPSDVRWVTETGWFGADHPRDASAGWGEEMLEATAQFCCELIDELQKIELPPAAATLL